MSGNGIRGRRIMVNEVNRLELVKGCVQVRSFFEGPQAIEGVIRSIDFLKHRVLLEAAQLLEDATASLESAMKKLGGPLSLEG